MSEQGVYIHELATAGPLSANDYFIADTGTAEVKVPFSALQEQIMVGNYTNVTDWDSFKPGTTREVKRGYSTGGAASGVPVEGDNITYYGWVEGVTTYCTQHLYTMYTGSAANRNRYWLRQCLNSVWGEWVEVTKNWWNQRTISDLDATTADGLYNFPSTATGIPEGWGDTSGTVFVYGSSSTYVYQTAFRKSAANVPTVYHRSKSSSGWGKWYLLDATGKSVQNAETRTSDIDLFPSYGVYGVWWVNLTSSAGVTGTKPYSSGQGVLMCLKQSADIVREVFIPVSVAANKMTSRYYTISTGVWTVWTESLFVGGIRTYTRTLSVGTGSKTSEIDISTLSDNTVINAVLTGDSIGSSSLCRVNSIVIDKLRNKLRVETYNGESGAVTLTFAIYYM